MRDQHGNQQNDDRQQNPSKPGCYLEVIRALADTAMGLSTRGQASLCHRVAGDSPALEVPGLRNM